MNYIPIDEDNTSGLPVRKGKPERAHIETVSGPVLHGFADQFGDAEPGSG